jgi:hypothetical protein
VVQAWKEECMFGRYFAAAAMGIVLTTPTLSFGEDGGGRHPRGVDARQQRQAARLGSGVRSGELTRGELNRLRADEAGNRAEERVYRRSGDGLTRWERRDLQRDLSRTSRKIYRAKHNDRAPVLPQ